MQKFDTKSHGGAYLNAVEYMQVDSTFLPPKLNIAERCYVAISPEQ